MEPPTRGEPVEPLSRSEPPATSQEFSSEMPIMRFLGIQIHVPAPPGVYRAILEATPDTLNSNGAVHGAALAALIDHSAGYGLQQLIGRRAVTSDLHIRYLYAAHAGNTLTAEARVVRSGRTQIVMDVRVNDDAGRLIAIADLALAVRPVPGGRPPAEA